MTPGIAAQIVERHANEVALLWPLRDAAVRDVDYDLVSLGDLDERVEANLDGLRLAGEAGAAAASAALADGPGELFAATAIAVERADLRGVAAVLDLAATKPALGRAFVSALGWCRFESLAKILPGLLSVKSPPALQHLGIAASAVHRRHPGPALANATASSDARLRARAIRAVGEIGTRELLAEVRGDLAAADEGCRFAAGWTGTLLGDATAPGVLCELASNGGRHAVVACDLAMRRAAPADASRWLDHLSRGAATRRTAIAGAAALGDPAAIGWLVELLDDDEVARPALEAVMTIAGVDAARAGFTMRRPRKRLGPSDDPNDGRVGADPDAARAWPNVATVKAWWSRDRARYPRGTRLFLGRPPAGPWLAEVLRHGSQTRRVAAALELALATPGAPLFQFRAPAFRQTAALR